MKTFFAIATVAVLTSSATAATCSSSVLSALLTDQYIDQCSTDSGYVFTAASIPTQDIIDKMCASSACRNLLADTQAMNLTECTLPVGDNIELLADLIDYVPPRCPSASGSASVASTGSATTGTATAGSTATGATVGSTAASTTGGSNTVTAPTSSASSTASSGTSSGETPTTSTTSKSAAADTSAASSGSSDASTVTRAFGVASLAAVAVAYFL